MSDKKSWTEVTATPDAVWDRSAPIEGEIIKVRENVGPNSSMLYSLLTEAGEVAVWGSTALDPKLSELYLHDQVRIEPLGKVKSPKTGREYWDFRVSFIEGDRSELAKPRPVAEEVTPVLGDEDSPIDLSDIPF